MALPQTNINAFTGMNAPTRSDPDNFDARAEDAWNRLKAAQPQMNTLAGQVNDMATSANTSATNAATSASNAATSASNAATSKTGADTAKTAAETAKTAAEAARDVALGAVDSLTATSTTSNVIGVAAKAWTGAGLAGKSFKVGQRLRAVNPTNTAQWMEGTVTGYTNSGAGSSITINITDVNSTTAGNTVANWSFTIAGEKGVKGDTGGLSGGNATGAVNLRRGSNVTVASGIADIWSAAGNLLVLNSPATVVDFPDAPQAGAERTIYISGATTIQSGTRIYVSGGTQSLVAGDVLDVLAIEVGVFLVNIRKRDGTPVAFNQGAFHNLRQYAASSVFTATKTGWHKISGTGGAGSGGVASADVGGCAGATGGGAGGFFSGMRYLTAGTSYVVMVGAGGALVSKSSGTGSIDGNDGSATSFSGTGITTLTANGGGKGHATVAAGVAVDGGAGGTATGAGGDMLVTGGNGGLLQPLVAGALAATGGGAVGLRGISPHGGDAQATASGARAAGGGGGVGGKGGNAISSSANTAVAAAGGGAAGPAPDVTNINGVNGGFNFQGVSSGGASYPMPNDLDSATGGGGAVGATTAAPNGGGTAGRTSDFSGSVVPAAGMFAGGGGATFLGNDIATASTGGQHGGASGGVAGAKASSTSTSTATGAPGRAGSLWIEF